jgi:hypothetical protein
VAPEYDLYVIHLRYLSRGASELQDMSAVETEVRLFVGTSIPLFTHEADTFTPQPRVIVLTVFFATQTPCKDASGVKLESPQRPPHSMRRDGVL